LELAIELRAMGWEIWVAAFLSGEPMASEFEKRKFQILDILTPDSALSNAQFDLAWIHHSPVFYELFMTHKIEAAMVVFCSLSPFEPLEAIPAHRENLDLLLANSIENRNFIAQEFGLNRDQVVVFPNAVPNVYWNYLKEFHSPVLKSIAIVSNHPPPEALAAAAILEGNGVAVTHIGRGGMQMLMAPTHLLNYDAIITIGKTVPYCFALKVPVYCYDHFGGPGWLNEDNFDLANQNNFSGRGFFKKTPEDIAHELAHGYRESIRRLDVYRNHAMNKRNLGKNLELLLSQPRMPMPKQLNITDSKETLTHHAQYMRLAKILRAREAELGICKKEVSRVKSTLSWHLTSPFRIVYNFVRHMMGLR